MRQNPPTSVCFNRRAILAICLLASSLSLASLTALPARSALEPSTATSIAGAWNVFPAPSTSATVSQALQSVACATASECWAVGSYYFDPNFNQTLIMRWDGRSWSIVSSPNTSPAQSNALHSVACASPTQCWAVGAYVSGGV